MLAQTAATPVRMRRQQLANLLQIGRGNVPPLNEARFVHLPQLGRGWDRSPALNETILAPHPMAVYSSGITSNRPPDLRRTGRQMTNHHYQLRKTYDAHAALDRKSTRLNS